MTTASRALLPRDTRFVVKRTIDIAVAATALVFSAPVLAAEAILVRLFLGRPVIFRQQRPGLNGELFTLYKFRSMRDLVASDGQLLPDAARLTSFGRFLRSTSLDELPELFNVVRGEMSLVGPRPLLMEYLERYSPEQARRHEMKPGLTGWAQVNGRNALDWDRRFALDIWYVDHWTLALDLRILVRTVAGVLTGRHITAPGHATTPYFMPRSSAGND